MVSGQMIVIIIFTGGKKSHEDCEELLRHDVKTETLRDLIVIDVGISCDDYPFLDSGL